MRCLVSGTYTVTVRRIGNGTCRFDLLELFERDRPQTAVEPVTWGRIKALYAP